MNKIICPECGAEIEAEPEPVCSYCKQPGTPNEPLVDFIMQGVKLHMKCSGAYLFGGRKEAE